jgi:hypothetical protein
MDPVTIAAILALVETIIQETPQAIALWNAAKAALLSGTDPTTAQWVALAQATASAHAKVQAG